MTDDFIIDDIKNRLEEYLKAHSGVNLSKPHFNCLNPAHTDSKPSMAYDRKRNKAHCFSCGADYDTLDIIGIEYGLSEFKDQLEKAKEIFHISGSTDNKPKAKEPLKKEKLTPATASNNEKKDTEPDFTEYLLRAYLNTGKTDYYKKRGISKETIEKYRLGYDPEVAAVIIPVNKGYYIKRSVEGKAYYNLKDAAVVPFNLKSLKEPEPVFVVEGAFDALSIIEAGGQAVGLNGATHISKLIAYIKDNKLNPLIIICLDNDNAGKEAAGKLATALNEINIKYYESDINGNHKDPNEHLINDRAAFVSCVEEAIGEVKRQVETEKQAVKEEYMQGNAKNYISDFFAMIKDKMNTPPISTGFNRLDEMLDGGLFEGLYVIGAISSLGKTTFILQMGDQIAATGKDVLIFSLEMAKYELIAKSISRYTFLNCSGNTKNAKTTRGVTNGSNYKYYNQEEMTLIQKAVNGYSTIAGNIFILEGIGDIGAEQIRQAVEKHKSITGETPVAIIDYLQIIAPADVRATDKQNTDKAVVELKRISRDFKTPVLAISSLNRENYSLPISMAAFKESGAIEYSSDVLIGLQAKGAGEKGFNIDDAKKKDPREVELKVLKNRNGRTGGSIQYSYYPMFNYFEEERAEEFKRQ